MRTAGCLILIIAVPLLLAATFAMVGILVSLVGPDGGTPRDLGGWLLLGIIGLLGGVVIVLAPIAAVLGLIFGIGAWTGMDQVSLIISPEGVEFHQMSGRIVTP